MQNWQDTFGGLKEQYVKRSAERIQTIVELLAALIQRPENRELLLELRQAFHWLSGSGAMYGYAKASSLGVEGEAICDALLANGRLPEPEQFENFKKLLNAVASEFAEPDRNRETTSLALAKVPQNKNEILIIEEDQLELAALARLVEEHGMGVKSARSAFGAYAELRKSMPAGVILEIPLPDGDAYEFVEKLRTMKDGENLAVIIVSKHAGFLDKVRSIHCGADAHYEKPFDVKTMFRRVRYLLDKNKQEPPRILSVEDDPDQAAFIRAFLDSAGYQVRTCTDPKQFEAALSAFQPDLVLLDVMLPGMTGYELARYLRQTERYVTLPIIFLTTQGHLEARIEAAKSGVDEHLVKPVAPALLLSVVSAKLERARFLKTLLHKDGLTNLLNYSAFMEQAQTVVAHQKRHAGSVGMLILDLDYFRSINERHGFTGGDKVLVTLSLLVRKRLRQSDIIGRVGGDEIAIVAEGLDEQEAIHLASRLLADFSATAHSTTSHAGFYATASSGIAMLDAKTMDAESWIGLAYESLAKAKSAGRNCAVAASSSSALRH
jgi:diguanylate cyclase (GGDEF)-like protein